ncbi:MAG: T9SS type A sorting domain-containing protein [Sphingobacteriales bacterium]|nr:T9SS type A sorting domain-containing protein [Sphingobacteriales bacterium]
MKHILAFALLLFSFSLNLFSQEDNRHFCGTDLYMEELFQQYPQLREQIHQESITRDLTPYRMQRRESVRIIPVVFHIIHQGGPENIPDEDIYAVLKRINEDFRKMNADTNQIRDIFKGRVADMNIEFRLAKIDPNGKCTNGINRIYSNLTENSRDNVKNLIDWDNMKYLNIWVVKSIYNSSGVGTILGYSYFPQSALQNPKLDGIVIRADVTNYNGRTLTHELGHYFGLPHTFQGGCGTDCKTTGDYICDTPPVYEDTYGCDKTKNTCHNDVPDEPDMTENHMDYTSCRVMFSAGQKEVVDYYLNSQYRSNLWKASNLAATGVNDVPNIACSPVARFEVPYYAFCTGAPVTVLNKSLGPDNMQFTWYLPGSSNPVFDGKEPVVTYDQPGKYTVKLKVKSVYGTDSVEQNAAVMIYPPKGEPVTFKEGFEDNNFSNDFWYVDPGAGNIVWKRTTSAKFEGNKSFYLNNFSYSSAEREFYFILPPLDLSQTQSPYLYFTYAHARKSDASKDLLRVYVSSDCGKNWSLRDITNQIKLPTVTDFYTTQFIPSASQWREKFIDISNYQGKENLLVKIGFYAAGGNNIYIDNIKVYSAVSVPDALNSNLLSIYPNPADNQLNISYFNAGEKQYSLQVSDMKGKIVYETVMQANQGINNYSVDISSIQTDGVYLVSLISDGVIMRHKLLIFRKK